MKSAVALAALALALPGLAHAANINGTYAVRYTTLCQSIENEVFTKTASGAQQTTINTIDQGRLQQTIGLITFKPSAAGGTSGTVTATLTQAKGSLAILGMPGPPVTPAAPDMKIGTASQSGTYTLTLATPPNPSTLQIAFTGEKSETFTAYPSKLVSGVYGHVDFENLDGPINGANHCINTGTVDHQ